jgi:hypothetical protein
MHYTLIDRAAAPARMPDRGKRRSPEIDQLVAALTPGKVARVELTADEKPRGIIYRILRSAARQGRVVDAWEVGGFVYAELARSDDEE